MQMPLVSVPSVLSVVSFLQTMSCALSVEAGEPTVMRSLGREADSAISPPIPRINLRLPSNSAPRVLTIRPADTPDEEIR